MADARLLAGKITRLEGGMESGISLCIFRLGNVPCRARGALAIYIVGGHGWPGHEIEVTGNLVVEGRKKLLDIEQVRMLD